MRATHVLARVYLATTHKEYRTIKTSHPLECAHHTLTPFFVYINPLYSSSTPFHFLYIERALSWMWLKDGFIHARPMFCRMLLVSERAENTGHFCSNCAGFPAKSERYVIDNYGNLEFLINTRVCFLSQWIIKPKPTIERIYLSELKDNQLYEYFIDYFMLFQQRAFVS